MNRYAHVFIMDEQGVYLSVYHFIEDALQNHLQPSFFILHNVTIDHDEALGIPGTTNSRHGLLSAAAIVTARSSYVSSTAIVRLETR